jgi:hypothetical protein
MSYLSTANAKAKKKYKSQVSDITLINQELARFLSSMRKQSVLEGRKAVGDIKGANAYLQQQLASDSGAGLAGINSEQNRLGIQGGADTAGYSADAAFGQNIAAQAGNNIVHGAEQGNANTYSADRMLMSMRKASKLGALHDFKEMYKQQIDYNKEAYKKMLASYRRYSSYGGGGYGGYGGGGYTSYSPYPKAPPPPIPPSTFPRYDSTKPTGAINRQLYRGSTIA